jgi:hypothetical protein
MPGFIAGGDHLGDGKVKEGRDPLACLGAGSVLAARDPAQGEAEYETHGGSQAVAIRSHQLSKISGHDRNLIQI